MSSSGWRPTPTLTLRITEEAAVSQGDALPGELDTMVVFSVRGYVSFNVGRRFLTSLRLSLAAKLMLFAILGAFVWTLNSIYELGVKQLLTSHYICYTALIIAVALLVFRGSQMLRLVNFSVCFARDESVIRARVGVTTDRVYAYATRDKNRLANAIKQWSSCAEKDAGWRILPFDRQHATTVDNPPIVGDKGRWSGLRSIQMTRRLPGLFDASVPSGFDALVRHSLSDSSSTHGTDASGGVRVNFAAHILQIYRPIFLLYASLWLALLVVASTSQVSGPIFTSAAAIYAVAFLFFHFQVVRKSLHDWLAHPIAPPYANFESALMQVERSGRWTNLRRRETSERVQGVPWALAGQQVVVKFPEAFQHVGVVLTIEALLHAIHILHSTQISH